MKFSQRISKLPIRASLQLESIDEALRNKLWNIIYMAHLNQMPDWISEIPTERRTFLEVLWHAFFKLPIDNIPHDGQKIVLYIKTWYFKAQWFEVYDLLEFLADYDVRNRNKNFASTCNVILEQEMAAYRIIDNQVTPITDEHELREIEVAIENSRKTRLASVLEHLETALAKLADRKDPDFRNSIKESISAVEAISKLIANKPKADLDEALSAVEKKVPIHAALKKAYLSIYGYTSDSDGIRHSLTEQSNAEFEDAKFMLVACAAFINYLVVKSQKAGIQL